ncbi:MAG: hypothetical protein ABFC98_05920 [Candidatus Cloacimonas sp.]
MEQKIDLLTLYVFPGDKETLDDKQRIIDSCKEIRCNVVFLSYREELEIQQVPDTKWWGYLFGNEWFEKDISEVLNIYLEQANYNVLTFFKDITKENGEKAVFLASRIFRSWIVPLGIETYKEVPNLSFIKVLDGWIKQEG